MLRKKKDNEVDAKVHALHHEAFEKFDCLSCGNCCRTTSPRFLQTDIQRLARHLKMKVSDFIDTYLVMDEDSDYVFPAPPCPFLLEDNKCLVYEHRPQACREYPHTNRKRFRQILSLSIKNASICPVVFGIFDKLGKQINGTGI
ncbi:MAG: YkgJ family cysteine cluster protein [Cyclobacteriaceae bacterium]|nr:YkgJ family cysteine cluster protein [Cyclobacteriaceae bacterium]